MSFSLACKVSAASGFMGIPLYKTLCPSLAAFRSLFILALAILIMICYGVGLLGFLSVSCTWIFISFFRFGKFSAIISSNTFLIPFSLFSFWNLYNANIGNFHVISESLYVAIVLFLSVYPNCVISIILSPRLPMNSL